MINWGDPSCPVSKYFTVKDMTWLPSWSCYHNPTNDERVNLMNLALKMDLVREILNKPIHTHVTIRPISVNCPGSPHHGGNYNAAIGSTALKSAHISGLAMDFDVGENCDQTRATLEPHLEKLGMRLERNPGSSWVHLDLAPVPPGGHRYFSI